MQHHTSAATTIYNLYTYLPLLDKLGVDKGLVHGIDIQVVTMLGLLLVLVVETKFLTEVRQGGNWDLLDGSPWLFLI